MTWNNSERSYAKLNLFLKLLFKREDNYHELSSLFCKIDFFDEITFETAKKDELTADLFVPEPFKATLAPVFLGSQKEQNLMLQTVKKVRHLFEKLILNQKMEILLMITLRELQMDFHNTRKFSESPPSFLPQQLGVHDNPDYAEA